MTGKTLLRADHVSAGYGNPGRGKKARDIISDVSFTLREGERLAIVGPNGSGKTTLLRVLAGALPYRGSLRQTIQDPLSARFGEEVERSRLGPREAARETGFLSQLSSSWFPFQVEDVVMLGRYARQKPGFAARSTAEDRKAVWDAMEACGITDIRNESLSHLSGGQAQRVFLARTLAQEPAILLLDEPTNHLDLHYQVELLELVKKSGRASIGVFHDLSLALSFADTAILLDGGTIADEGSPRDVLAGEQINRTYRMDVAGTIRALLQNW